MTTQRATGTSEESLLSFTASDCELFGRYPERLRFTDEYVPASDKAKFRSVRNRLKEVAGEVARSIDVGLPLHSFVSSLNPNGRSPLDMWCCLHPQDAPNKSYALQVALIIGSLGAEVCICMGAGTSQLNDPDERAAAERYFANVRKCLRTAGPELIRQVEQQLPAEAQFLTAWRTPGASPAFTDLRSWLLHAGGPHGAQAAISRHFTPAELAAMGSQITMVFHDFAEAAVPLLQLVSDVPDRRSGNHEAGTFETQSDADRPRPLISAVFDWSVLRQRAAEGPSDLLLDDDVYRATVAAIQSGKHVIFTGPPGTAKTTLAGEVCRLAADAGLCAGHLLTTATADWTTYDTIGGLQPSQNNGKLEFRAGQFIDAASSGRWLIVDELNRSNFDRAFGQFFSILSGQSVVLPFRGGRDENPIALVVDGQESLYPPDRYEVIAIPASWRIVATMNVFDKSLLFEMSYALMRRFAFIEVPSPSVHDLGKLWARPLAPLSSPNQQRATTILEVLQKLRSVKDIGPAVFLDMARFMATYIGDSEDWDTEALAYQLFFSYLLPQFEGVSVSSGQQILDTMKPILGGKLRARLRQALTDALGLNFPSRVHIGDSNLRDEASDDL